MCGENLERQQTKGTVVFKPRKIYTKVTALVVVIDRFTTGTILYINPAKKRRSGSYSH